MNNKCTLIIDGNWLLMNKLFVGSIQNYFNVDNDQSEKIKGMNLLVESMAQSISFTCRRFTDIVDNIIYVQDGGSWRKSIVPPVQLSDADYKGTRKKSSNTDWTYVFEAANTLANNLKSLNIQTHQEFGVEGDDWVFYWSKKLLESGSNVIIWSIDNDLKQLVRVSPQGNFVSWFQNKAGLFLPMELQKETTMEDDIDMFMQPDIFNNTLENLKKKFKPDDIHYIDSWKIVVEKIICGDVGDNVLPIYSWRKGKKNYKLTEKYINEIINRLKIKNIPEFIDRWEDVNSECMKVLKGKELLFENKIIEHFYHNVQMVWLNDSVYPDNIKLLMESNGDVTYTNPSIIKDISQNLHTISSSSNEQELDTLFTDVATQFDDIPF